MACKRCGTGKVGSNSKSGICRSCYLVDYYSKPENRQRKSENGKAWAKRHPERHRQKSLDWQKNNPDRAKAIAHKTYRSPQNRFTRAKGRAAKRGFTWAISFEDFSKFLLQRCAYCGGELDQIGCALDRKDSAVGYEISNVVPCCGECNRIKGPNLTHEEMKAAMLAILAVRESKISL